MKKRVAAPDELTCLSLVLAWLIAIAQPQFSTNGPAGEVIVRGVNFVELTPCGWVTILAPLVILTLYSFPFPRMFARRAHRAVSAAYILCTTIGTAKALQKLSQWGQISVRWGLPLAIVVALATIIAFARRYRAEEIQKMKEDVSDGG